MTLLIHIFALILGLVLGILFIQYANWKGRNPSGIYALGLFVAALIYPIFAIFTANLSWIGIELLGVLCYGLFCLLGMRYQVGWIALGWLLHPLWDIALHLYGPGNHIISLWYTVPCFSFDVLVGLYILIKKGHQYEKDS